MENIVENNKLIADFMGFAADKSFEVKLADGINTSYYYYKDDVMYLPEAMAYHSDWNWLMEVVEKIQSLDIYYDKYIDHNSSMFTSGKIELSTKIEAVYTACIEFIKWYNEQKQSS